MAAFKSDPLLSGTRYLLLFIMGLLCLGVVVGAIGIGAILVVDRQVLIAKLAAQGLPPEMIPAIIGVILFAMSAATIFFFFSRELLRIVRSVGERDPFVPVNAERLRRMAWLTLATQPLLYAGTMLVASIEKYTKSIEAQSDAHISLGGILLALILFILARVFRTGTEMRAELEGTV